MDLKNRKTESKSKSSLIASKKTESQEFEVDKLIKHRGRKGNREFLVRWKGFGTTDDTWEKEQNLCLPKILNHYLKKNRLTK